MKKLSSKSFTFLFFLLLGLSTSVDAQKYSNEFLAIGVGARAHAMGGSVIASVSDVTASYWNPSALASMDASKGVQLGAMHAEWFAGIGKYDYLGATLPMANKNRRLGLSLVRFGIDNIPNTLSLYDSEGRVNYDNIRNFSAADYAFLTSYAQKVQTKKGALYLGGNVKIVRRVIGTFANSWGFGLDLSAQYKRENLQIGVIARDLTNTFNAWKINFSESDKEILLDTGNELPKINSLELTKPSITLGVSYTINRGNWSFLPEIDALVTTDGQRNALVSSDPISIAPTAGLEIGYKSFLHFRGGVSQFQEETGLDREKYWTFRPSMGVGLKISGLTVDYAFANLGDSNNRSSHIISLLLNIAPKSSKE